MPAKSKASFNEITMSALQMIRQRSHGRGWVFSDTKLIYFLAKESRYIQVHVSPDEMLRNAAFHVGLLYLPRYALSGH